MGNNRIITLIDGYKEVGEVELICAFKVKELNKKYIIYTKNEHEWKHNYLFRKNH